MKRLHLIALIVIAISLGIIISMLAQSGSYETFASAAKREGRTFHIVGKLAADKEQEYNPGRDPNYFSFWMADNEGAERKIVFKGAKPHDFDRSEQIVLKGKMKGDEFHASSILMKCPSKYINTELNEEGYSEVKAGS